MRLSSVIPVVTIDDVSHAQPVAQALMDGGICVIEVTLRTSAAFRVIREMQDIAGAIVGAGSVLNERDLDRSLAAGAKFIVSPGLTEPLTKAALDCDIPFLPGVANASDLMRGLDLGLTHFKFFPAVALGGIPYLQALAAPFREARFCPTGGITPASALDWLSLSQVICIGGSWVVPSGTLNTIRIADNARQTRQWHVQMQSGRDSVSHSGSGKPGI